MVLEEMFPKPVSSTSMRNLITGLVAPKGSGKTYKAVELMSKMPRVAMFNVVRKDVQVLGPATHVFDGRPLAFHRALTEPSFCIIYRPTVVEVGEKGEAFYPTLPMFMDACFKRGDMTAVIDEAHLLCDPYHIPPSLFNALALGRHEELSLLYVTQSWSMVHRLLTRNSDEFYFWKIIEPSDLNGIAERCGSEVADRVAALRKTEDHRPEGGELVPGEYLHWTGWGGVEERTEALETIKKAIR